jgi:hypothetical protein
VEAWRRAEPVKVALPNIFFIKKLKKKKKTAKAQQGAVE